MYCSWEGNRRSGSHITLAMWHRLKWFIHLWAQVLSNVDDHPTYTRLGVAWYFLPAERHECHLTSINCSNLLPEVTVRSWRCVLQTQVQCFDHYTAAPWTVIFYRPQLTCSVAILWRLAWINDSILLSLISIFYFSIHVIFSYSAFRLQECSIKSFSQSVSVCWSQTTTVNFSLVSTGMGGRLQQAYHLGVLTIHAGQLSLVCSFHQGRRLTVGSLSTCLQLLPALRPRHGPVRNSPLTLRLVLYIYRA